MFRRWIVGNAAPPHYGLETISKIVTLDAIHRIARSLVFFVNDSKTKVSSREIGYVMP